MSSRSARTSSTPTTRRGSGAGIDEPGTYADLEAETVHNRTYEWNHTLSDVVGAVIGAGLNVELLSEHDYTLFPRWPFLVKSGFDAYRLPETMPKLPLMYSLRARK